MKLLINNAPPQTDVLYEEYQSYYQLSIIRATGSKGITECVGRTEDFLQSGVYDYLTFKCGNMRISLEPENDKDREIFTADMYYRSEHDGDTESFIFLKRKSRLLKTACATNIPECDSVLDDGAVVFNDYVEIVAKTPKQVKNVMRVLN